MKIPATLFIVATLFLCGCQTVPEHRPEVAGQQVPNQNINLDFTKHYDLICRDGGSSRVYAGCQIIGYTGEAVRGVNGLSFEGYGLGHWLVIELPDRRRVFISPGCIEFIEESKK